MTLWNNNQPDGERPMSDASTPEPTEVYRMVNTHPPRRRLPLAAGLGSLLVILGACSSAASSSESASQAASQSTAESVAPSKSAAESTPAGPTVTITGTASFGTDEITVPAGEKLTVVNDSSVSHTFTEGTDGVPADGARVDEQIVVGTTTEVAFPEPGNYHITCLIHHVMNMVVHVK
jgi:plastocyanin